MILEVAFGKVSGNTTISLPSAGSLYMGIDPGTTGAVAIVGPDGFATVSDIPTMTVGRSGKTKSGNQKTAEQYHYGAINAFFRMINKEIKNKGRLRVCLEKAQVMVVGKAPVSSRVFTAFKVGVGYGMWPLFLSAWGYSVEEVNPAEWKKVMGLRKADKEASRTKAISLFPNVNLSRKKDHNRAEALLLAEYLRRKMGGS